jgi:hypothetical protein
VINWIADRARERGLAGWLVPYLCEYRKRRVCNRGDPVHLLLCIADHYEPSNGGVSHAIAQSRVEAWVRDYPQRFACFRDKDGRAPQHTFFYPLEQYDPSHLEGLKELCISGFGEVEVHLHHDSDTAERLSQTLVAYKQLLSRSYGLLARHRKTEEVKFGFIHGDWALDNSRPDGSGCGVNNELDVLREAGCYADFTLPSAPSVTQTRKINSIYYAIDDPRRPKSHDTGIDVGTGRVPSNALMLIQGPLLFNWRHRKFGVFPRVENACIQGNQSPSAARLHLWLRARVQVPGRPDWFFVKLHTHGAPEKNQKVLLGDPMVRFHEELVRRSTEDREFHFHYVTAREMYNLAKAAEAGWKGSVAEARDFELLWNGRCPAASSLSTGATAN